MCIRDQVLHRQRRDDRGARRGSAAPRGAGVGSRPSGGLLHAADPDHGLTAAAMRRRRRGATVAMVVGVGLVVLAGAPPGAAWSGALPIGEVAALAAVVGPGAPDVVGMLDAARTALPLAPPAVPALLPLPVERLQEAATRVVALQMWTAELRA